MLTPIFSTLAYSCASSIWHSTKKGHTTTCANDQIHRYILEKTMARPYQNHATYLCTCSVIAGVLHCSALLWPTRMPVSHFVPHNRFAQPGCSFDSSSLFRFLAFLVLPRDSLDLRDPPAVTRLTVYRWLLILTQGGRSQIMGPTYLWWGVGFGDVLRIETSDYFLHLRECNLNTKATSPPSCVCSVTL